MMPNGDLTGLELLKAIMSGDCSAQNMADTIPMKLDEAKEGFVRFLVKAEQRHTNLMGGVHGGFSATVIDTITGCAVCTVMEAGVSFTTIDLNVKMLRPIPIGKELIAEGKLINRSRRLGIADGKIIDEDGKLYATGSATCMILN